jgi:hypothetical protein
MFNSLFVTSPLNRRKTNKTMEEVQLVLLRQVIRFNKLLNRAQSWIVAVREYYWVPVLAFLFGVMIGLVITTVT